MIIMGNNKREPVYSTYSHPYQLRGLHFKTRTYHTEAAMDAAAAKILASGEFRPAWGHPILFGYRDMQPKGMPHGLYVIKTYYPPAEDVLMWRAPAGMEEVNE